jgi:threonylcarbamoyladenosine tRNA methylthiotransferase MtaB
MPQVDGKTIKERAARLRAKGEAALTRHLDRRVGMEMTALMERDCQARGADFSPIALDAPARPGALVRVQITGHDGARLIGQAMEAAA